MTTTNSDTPDVTPPHILVVEDDTALNDAFCMVLESAYPTVYGVYNGQQALEYLADHDVDLILLDILMPVMDGRSFLRKFKNPGIPVVILSNLDARTDIESVLKLGATDYLLKSSASPQELLTLTAKYVSHE